MASWFERSFSRPVSRRRALVVSGLLAPAIALSSGCRRPRPFPPADTPEGAWAHVCVALADDRPEDLFAYLEDEAQWAVHTLRKERATALAAARKSYPADALAPLEAELGADAASKDAPEVFVRLARKKGWLARLRKDLSGVARVERDGDRATLVTARGNRVPLKRRTVGLWGLTMFTAELIVEAEKSTRDRVRVEEAAKDYALAKGK